MDYMDLIRTLNLLVNALRLALELDKRRQKEK